LKGFLSHKKKKKEEKKYITSSFYIFTILLWNKKEEILFPHKTIAITFQLRCFYVLISTLLKCNTNAFRV